MALDAPEVFSIDLLVPHPMNPRLSLNDERIKSIAIAMKDKGFDPAYAIVVRWVNNMLEVLSGHHRLGAAKLAGLASVPCWVRDLDDYEAYMLLVTGNNQGELTPLEIGLHALHLDEVSKASGKKGALAAYSKMIGKSATTVSEGVTAARVAEAVSVDRHLLSDKTKHLHHVHGLPKDIWEFAVKRMLKYDWSASETETRVKHAKTLDNLDAMKNYFGKALPVPKVEEEPAKMQEEIRSFYGVVGEGEYGVGESAPVGGEILSRSLGELSASESLEMDVEPEESGSVVPRNAGLQDSSKVAQGGAISSGQRLVEEVTETVTPQVATVVAVRPEVVEVESGPVVAMQSVWDMANEDERDDLLFWMRGKLRECGESV